MHAATLQVGGTIEINGFSVTVNCGVYYALTMSHYRSGKKRGQRPAGSLQPRFHCGNVVTKWLQIANAGK